MENPFTGSFSKSIRELLDPPELIRYVWLLRRIATSVQ